MSGGRAPPRAQALCAIARTSFAVPTSRARARSFGARCASACRSPHAARRWRRGELQTRSDEESAGERVVATRRRPRGCPRASGARAAVDKGETAGQRIEQVRDVLVAAVDRERVLGEVVRPVDEEVGLARERATISAADGTSISCRREIRIERIPARIPPSSLESPRATQLLSDEISERAGARCVCARAQDRAQLARNPSRCVNESRIERQPSCGFSSCGSARFATSLSPPRSSVRIVTDRGASSVATRS